MTLCARAFRTHEGVTIVVWRRGGTGAFLDFKPDKAEQIAVSWLRIYAVLAELVGDIRQTEAWHTQGDLK